MTQPIAAAVTHADASLRWLDRDPPNLDEARAALIMIVKDGTVAKQIIERIRLLFKKGTPQLEWVDVNEVIREMIILLHGEVTRFSISVRMELARDLPYVVGDRVQLQQVMMNLITNSIDAMKEADGTRELAIKSGRAEDDQLAVCVSDTGVGLPPQLADQIFNTFFTTKPTGRGWGCRFAAPSSKSHGGRLWATDNIPRGANFDLVLARGEPQGAAPRDEFGEFGSAEALGRSGVLHRLAADGARGMSKSKMRSSRPKAGSASIEDCGAPSGRVLFLVGSLSAPRLRRYVRAPSPRLPPLPRAAYERPAEMDPGFPTRAGGRRAPEVVRYTGRETRDHSFSDEAAGPFRGSPQAPHPRPEITDGLQLASSLDEGWVKSNAAWKGWA